jgi:hypothetical protein
MAIIKYSVNVKRYQHFLTSSESSLSETDLLWPAFGLPFPFLPPFSLHLARLAGVISLVFNLRLALTLFAPFLGLGGAGTFLSPKLELSGVSPMGIMGEFAGVGPGDTLE